MLNDIFKRDVFKSDLVIDFDKISKSISEGYDYVNHSELDAAEKIAVSTIHSLSSNIVENLYADMDYQSVYKLQRRLKIGLSDVAEAWTDGRSYIALNRALLKEANKGFAGFMRISLIMLHEHCHKNDDMGDHAHDFEFYNDFHDFAISPQIGQLAANAARAYAQALNNKQIKINKPIVLDQTADFYIENAYLEDKPADIHTVSASRVSATPESSVGAATNSASKTVPEKVLPKVLPGVLADEVSNQDAKNKKAFKTDFNAAQQSSLFSFENKDEDDNEDEDDQCGMRM